MKPIILDADLDALFLDLDGTMVDIAPRPEDVHAPGTLIRTLATLSEQLGGALAVVSGRSIAAVDAILAPLRLPAAGVHGAEMRFSGRGEIERIATAAIPNAVRWLLAPLASMRGVLVEDKTTAIAVHYRQAPEMAARVREIVMSAIAAQRGNDLAVIAGKCVLEIKFAACTKGTALAAFMARAPWLGRRPIYVGDDVTDEAAFAELPKWGGLGLAVGTARPGAQSCFQTAADVRHWLSGLVKQECPT